MKPETESSVSKAKTERRKPARGKKAAMAETGSPVESSQESPAIIGINVTSESSTPVAAAVPQTPVSDLEFLDTVKESVYRKLLNNELELKIDSGFKAIELKNKISESSENERLLLEILSEIRSDELNKSR